MPWLGIPGHDLRMGARDFFVSVVFAVALGLGLTMATSGHAAAEFMVARAAFAVAGIALAIGYFLWLGEVPRSRWRALSVGFLAILMAGAGLPVSLAWVNLREREAIPEKAAPASRPAIQSMTETPPSVRHVPIPKAPTIPRKLSPSSPNERSGQYTFSDVPPVIASSHVTVGTAYMMVAISTSPYNDPHHQYPAWDVSVRAPGAMVAKSLTRLENPPETSPEALTFMRQIDHAVSVGACTCQVNIWIKVPSLRRYIRNEPAISVTYTAENGQHFSQSIPVHVAATMIDAVKAAPRRVAIPAGATNIPTLSVLRTRTPPETPRG